MNRRVALLLALSTLIAAPAAAAPASIALTKDQVAAAAKAAAAKLPAVDQAKVDQCKKDHAKAFGSNPPGAAELDAAADCLRSAGALGAAIKIWRAAASQYAETPEGKDSARKLGAAYEAAGFYADAASAYSRFARTYPKEQDARDQMVRGVCTYEQLGADGETKSGLVFLGKTWPAVKVDPTTLCDTIRPIQPPTP